MKKEKKKLKKIVFNIGIGFICIIGAMIGTYIGKYHPEWAKISYFYDIYNNSDKLVNDISK